MKLLPPFSFIRRGQTQHGLPTYTLTTVRLGYPWVPTDQAHDRPRQVGPAY
jgi:hypothetical protein